MDVLNRTASAVLAKRSVPLHSQDPTFAVPPVPVPGSTVAEPHVTEPTVTVPKMTGPAVPELPVPGPAMPSTAHKRRRLAPACVDFVSNVWNKFAETVMPLLGGVAQQAVRDNRDPVEIGKHDSHKIQKEILENTYSKYRTNVMSRLYFLPKLKIRFSICIDYWNY